MPRRTRGTCTICSFSIKVLKYVLVSVKVEDLKPNKDTAGKSGFNYFDAKFENEG